MMKLSDIQLIIQHGKHHWQLCTLRQTIFSIYKHSLSSWGISLQKVKHLPWLSLQCRQLWQSLCHGNQYASRDKYSSVIKRNILHSVAYADDVHWAYLLCFRCNLPTSLCCPLVCRHKCNSEYMHINQCENAQAQLWGGFTAKATGVRSGNCGVHLQDRHKWEWTETTVYTQTFTNQHTKTTRGTKGKGLVSTMSTRHQQLGSQKEDSENLTSQRSSLLTLK